MPHCPTLLIVSMCKHCEHMLNIVKFLESIWKTDLDWLVPNNDRLIVLSFFTGGSTVALHAEVRVYIQVFSFFTGGSTLSRSTQR